MNIINSQNFYSICMDLMHNFVKDKTVQTIQNSA